MNMGAFLHTIERIFLPFQLVWNSEKDIFYHLYKYVLTNGRSHCILVTSYWTLTWWHAFASYLQDVVQWGSLLQMDGTYPSLLAIWDHLLPPLQDSTCKHITKILLSSLEEQWCQILWSVRDEMVQLLWLVSSEHVAHMVKTVQYI